MSADEWLTITERAAKSPTFVLALSKQGPPGSQGMPDGKAPYLTLVTQMQVGCAQVLMLVRLAVSNFTFWAVYLTADDLLG